MACESEERICNVLAGEDKRSLIRIVMSEVPFATIDAEVSTWEGIVTQRETGEQESDFLCRLLNGADVDVLYSMVTDLIPLQRLHQIAWDLQFNRYKATYKN